MYSTALTLHLLAPQKLQPFFPPLDQVRSVNLRAALLRCLEQAKKNGVLGRDAVLRKTMLDECKGDRLEEVLAVFSSAVLKKVVAEQQLNSSKYPAVAHSLALEKKGHSGDRTELNALVLAHTVSLRKKLDQKNAARLRYKNLAGLLDSKEESIARRIDSARELGSNQNKAASLSHQQQKDVRRALRNNWAGNERWMETLLYGDAYVQQDPLLSTPFDRVWRRVRADRLQELDDKASGLLKQLDDRVRTQQERLSKWHSLKRDMFGEKTAKPTVDPDAPQGQPKGLDFGFGAHESLQLGHSSSAKVVQGAPANLAAEYQELLDSFETDLQAIDRVSNAPLMPGLGRYTQPAKSPPRSESSDKAAEEPISELSELEEEMVKPSVVPKAPATSQLSRQETQRSLEPDVAGSRLDKARRPRLPQPLSTMHTFRPKTKAMEISPTELVRPPSPPRASAPSSRRSPILVSASTDTAPSPVPPPTRDIPPPTSPPLVQTQSLEEPPPSHTQQQADQILASMNAASPSPVKHPRPRPTLSLADRARLSMSRSTTLDFDDEEEVPAGSPTRLVRRNTSSRSPTKKKASSSTPTTVVEEGMSANEATVADEDDLVARTRKSMANFEAAQQKARLERQRSQKQAAKQSSAFARQKYFSAVGEEDGDGNSTAEVLEELIAKEAEHQGAVDYDAIFKSRPKIKASPPSTPVGTKGPSWDERED